MPYELRLFGSPPARFEDLKEATEAAAAALRIDRNAHIQVIDLATRRPAELGERRNWNEHHHKKRHGL